MSTRESSEHIGIPATPEQAIAWLASRRAHPWLVRHHELVVEAAGVLVDGMTSRLSLDFDRDHVLLGAALHDAGKILHVEEMRERGHAHEEAGRTILRDAGFPDHLARVCVTHAAWSGKEATIEDRLIALADKLWKGKRDTELEDALIGEIAERLGKERWEVFDVVDAICEDVARDAPSRLRRSNV